MQEIRANQNNPFLNKYNLLLFVIFILLIGIGVLILNNDSNEECRGKPNGTSCSFGVWRDWKGDICGGQSCVGMGLGTCSFGKCID